MLSGIRRTRAGINIGFAGAAEPVGFHGATPAAQRAGAVQTALTDSTGGVASVTETLVAVGVTNTGDVSAAINANFATVAVLLNELRAALVEKGLIKGAA
ncbi:MAG: hypothetical protein ACYDH9_08185 [Limisphaerales bacterium]